jgi:hypothetical protein
MLESSAILPQRPFSNFSGLIADNGTHRHLKGRCRDLLRKGDGNSDIFYHHSDAALARDE